MRPFAFALLLLASPLVAGEPVDLFSIDLMATSPDGGGVALAMNASRASVLTVSWVVRGKWKTASFSREEVEAALPDSAIADLAWSPDGRLLAVELIASEGGSAIALVDLSKPARLAPVSMDGHDNLALPRWGPKGAELWAVHGELGEAGDEEDTGGIFRFDVRTGKVSRILAGEWVTDFRISGSGITALIEGDEADDGSVLGKLVRYDLASGKRETIFRQRSAPSGRRGVITL